MIWMPYPDYRRSAKCLSDLDLRDQRNAIRAGIHQIVMFKSDKPEWVVRWENHMSQLLQLCEATLEERRRRGADERGITPWMLDHADPPPPWLGDKLFHTAQKLALLRKNPGHYERMGW